MRLSSATKAGCFLRATLHLLFLTLLCIFLPCPTLHPAATSVLCVPRAGLGFGVAPVLRAEEPEPLAPSAAVSLAGFSSADLTDGR